VEGATLAMGKEVMMYDGAAMAAVGWRWWWQRWRTGGDEAVHGDGGGREDGSGEGGAARAPARAVAVRLQGRGVVLG
jgi:hypothetical protein